MNRNAGHRTGTALGIGMVLLAGALMFAGGLRGATPSVNSSGDEAGFVSLFNGRDLAGWTGATNSHEVRDGAIVCRPGRGGVLFTTEQFGDFIVRVEFKLPPAGNNGLALRYPGTGRPAYDGFCEIQVADDAEQLARQRDPRQFNGSAYGIAAARAGHLRPIGEWNVQQVTVRGTRVKVELNGAVILDADLAGVPEFLDGKAHPGLGLKRGHFGFAGHKDPVRFRNIRLRRLDQGE